MKRWKCVSLDGGGTMEADDAGPYVLYADVQNSSPGPVGDAEFMAWMDRVMPQVVAGWYQTFLATRQPQSSDAGCMSAACSYCGGEKP